MFSRKDRFHLKKVKTVIISVSVLFTFYIIGYYLLGYMGLIYLKSDEGKKVYEFIEDMNWDGKKEDVKFVNHYHSYYKINACDLEYTSNYIRIYLDGKLIYKNKITTLGPLLNPKIVDLVESNPKKRQIYIHANGGGPVIPMDYVFYISEDKVVVNKIESDL